ncbi:N-formylglutamate amidohydrolase [Agrobacterium cavarae]|uniref:N-formylglutamate amidohydrolase n=1 Tax=Agrobacterium cavarae TaxID=2528239 RepID=UPI003FD210DD
MTENGASPNTSKRQIWSASFGRSPIIGTAIHDGHLLRDDLLDTMALSDEERLYEEDPYTGEMIGGLTNRIIGQRSRFEIDLNRARDAAVYLTPDQSWGLEVWRARPSDAAIAASLSVHDDYYAMLLAFLDRIERSHGRFIVLDVHSYNHRRQGADGPVTAQENAPDINIGTISMDRGRWAFAVDAVMEHFASAEIGGRKLDVRENIAFQGRGEQTRFVHETYPDTGCAIAIEFKKIFMDEWTGEPDTRVIADIRRTMIALEALLEQLLRERQ